MRNAMVPGDCRPGPATRAATQAQSRTSASVRSSNGSAVNSRTGGAGRSVADSAEGGRRAWPTRPWGRRGRGCGRGILRTSGSAVARSLRFDACYQAKGLPIEIVEACTSA